MNTINKQQGIGVLAIIFVIAIIAVGGYAIYQANVSNDMDMSDDQITEEIQAQGDEMLSTVATIEADVTETFARVKANLGLRTDEGLKLAAALLADLQVRIDAYAASLTPNAQAQVNTFKTRVGSAHAKVVSATVDTILDVEADVDAINADIETSFNDIEATVSADVDAMIEAASDDHDEDTDEMHDANDGDMEDDNGDEYIDPLDDSGMADQSNDDETMEDEGSSNDRSGDGMNDDGTSTEVQADVELVVE